MVAIDAISNPLIRTEIKVRMMWWYNGEKIPGNYERKVRVYNLWSVYELRTLITWWPLTCFDLAVETGRYKQDNSRDKRLCSTCNTLEDEYHLLFVCIRYRNIRNQYSNLLSISNLVSNCQSVSDMSKPSSIERAKLVGMYIISIEKARKDTPGWGVQWYVELICKPCVNDALW